MALIDIPADIGKGGANLGDGTPRLGEILQNHSDEILTAGNNAITAGQVAFGAGQRSFLNFRTEAFAEDFADLPPGVKETEIEFNEGTPLPIHARFLIAHILQFVTMDNAGHTLISASIGTHAEPEKYMSSTPINNGANLGKTLTAPGDGGLFLLAPINGDVPVLIITSVDDLNTITAGTLDVSLFYTNVS